jgi:hypothetical protein
VQHEVADVTTVRTTDPTQSLVLPGVSYRHRRRWYGLCLVQGASRQVVPWNAITQVAIRPESGMDVGMDVYTAEGRALELQDFERLPEIVSLVKAGIPPTVPVNQA